MMSDYWPSLFSNFAVIASLVSVWAACQDLMLRLPAPLRAPILGIWCGLCVMVVMLLPTALAPGVNFDLRGTVLAVTGLFGGPVAALFAGGMAMLYRINLGGAGLLAGLASIGLSTLVGLVGYRLWANRPMSMNAVYGFSGVLAVSVTMVQFLLPREIWVPRFFTFTPAAIVMTFLSTLMAIIWLRQSLSRQELARSNAVYRSIIDALPDCLNVKDMSGRFVAANPATATLMKATSPDRLIGKSDFDFYPAPVAREFRLEEERILSTGSPDTVDQHIIRADGSERWVSTLKVPLFGTDGGLSGLITHNRDITDRKQLESDLDSLRSRLNDALQTMNDAFSFYSKDGYLLMCNRQYQNLFPKSASARVPGVHCDDLMRAAIAAGEVVPPAGVDIEVWIADRRRDLLSGDNRLVPGHDGRWLQIRSTVVKEGVMIILSDVTEQKTAEIELKAAEAEYRTLFENSVAGIFRCDRDWKLVRANRAMARLHGYDSEEQLLDATAGSVVDIHNGLEGLAEFREAMQESRRVTDFVMEILRHSTRERIWVSVNAWTVFDADGQIKCYEGAVIDITERKRTEEQLEDANRKLEELASTDGLTGLANRRVFDETLAQEFARCRRDNATLSIVLIDVDRFKAYNDAYGHLAGDDCLRFVSQVFKTIARRSGDVACRFGGEELVAILPNASAEAALEIAENFRRAVRSLRIAHSGSDCGVVTISAGVATLSPQSVFTDPEALLRCADKALYRAKEGGRDRVLSAIAA